jgi:hypothetical protein
MNLAEPSNRTHAIGTKEAPPFSLVRTILEVTSRTTGLLISENDVDPSQPRGSRMQQRAI